MRASARTSDIRFLAPIPHHCMPNLDSKKPKLSWKKKLMFSAVVTLLFFGGAELVLTVLGVEPIADSIDTSAGFSPQAPLLTSKVNDDGARIMTTANNKLVWFNSQSFAATKPPKTRRVFCVGGSTTFGRPFNDTTSYVNWLRQLLPKVSPEFHWEVINAGGVSYASYRVAAVMEELANYEPDLFIVYSAQNEFLERRTYAK
ncbi:MAG: tetratricopeptide repeat protein, partial [Rubripirellula sp.]